MALQYHLPDRLLSTPRPIRSFTCCIHATQSQIIAGNDALAVTPNRSRINNTGGDSRKSEGGGHETNHYFSSKWFCGVGLARSGRTGGGSRRQGGAAGSRIVIVDGTLPGRSCRGC